jgi:hypothetical protein
MPLGSAASRAMRLKDAAHARAIRMRSSTINGRGGRESDDADILASWFEAGGLIDCYQVEPASFRLLVGLGALAGGCPLALRLYEPIVVESVAF